MEKKSRTDVSPLLAYYLSLNIAGHNFNEPVKWASGTYNPFYVDNRKAISNPKARHLIRKGLPSLIENPNSIDYVFPIPKAGIAPATLLALEIDKSLLIQKDNRYYSLDIAVVKELVETQLTEKVKRSDVIAGTIPYGIIFGIVIAEKLHKPFLFVREKPKDHGLGKQVEGIIRNHDMNIALIDPILAGEDRYTEDAIEAIKKLGKNISMVYDYPVSPLREIKKEAIAGKKVAIVEDLVSTGGSLLNLISGLMNDGAIISPCSVFSYELPSAQENFRKHGLINKSVVTFLEFMPVYAKYAISSADEQKIWEWYHNQENWGDINGFPRSKQ